MSRVGLIDAEDGNYVGFGIFCRLFQSEFFKRLLPVSSFEEKM